MTFNRTISIIIFFVLLGFGGFSYWFAMRLQSQFGTKQATAETAPEVLGENDIPASIYTNQSYRYSIQVPQHYMSEEYTPEIVGVVKKDENDFQRVAEGRIFVDQDGGNVEESVFDQLRFLCASTNAEYSVTCTDVTRREKFVTAQGSEGFLFYITEETRSIETDTVSQTVNKGPFFALTLESQAESDQVRTLILHPPFATPPDQIDLAVLQSLANSITFAQ